MDFQNIPLSKGLFWEADLDVLDLEAHPRYIIARVMDYGTWEEVQFIWKYYGSARIKSILIDAPSLQKRTIAFFAVIFDIPRDSFKATERAKAANWNR